MIKNKSKVELSLMYFYASLALAFGAITWLLVRTAEKYSPNKPRLRTFRLDQRDLWDYLTKKEI